MLYYNVTLLLLHPSLFLVDSLPLASVINATFLWVTPATHSLFNPSVYSVHKCADSMEIIIIKSNRKMPTNHSYTMK